MTTEIPEFYAILTNEGLKLQFECLSDNNKKFEMSEIAIGDGNGSYYEPEKSQTKLKNEVYRHVITRSMIDSNKLLKSVILDIPEDVSGFTIREVGVFGKDGELLIVGKYPATERRDSLSGAVFQHAVKIDLDVIDSTVLPLIDPSINTASVEYVETYFQKLSEKSKAGGYPELDENGTIPETQLPKVYADLELSNLNDKGRAKLDAKTNVSLNNLNDIGADKLNISKMYTTGDVSQDTQGFEQLKQMRHSTFDLSKFEVVGSPTITDDGVASGFSAGSYLTKTLSDNITLDKVNMYGTFILNANADTQKVQEILVTIANVPGDLTTTVIQLALVKATGRIGLAYHNNTTWSATYGDISPTPGNKYWYHIYYDTGSINLDLSTDGVNYTNYVSSSITVSDTISSSLVQIGSIKNGANYFTGSIDLKHFSINLDGKEVFSGNKTGLDVIKPDNYEVVGSPVISDDGVASGISASGYLTTTSSIDLSKPWKLTFKYTTANVDTSQGVFYFSDNCYLVQSSESRLDFRCFGATQSYWIKKYISANTTYYGNIGWDGNNYFFYLGTEKDNLTKVGSFASTTPTETEPKQCQIGIWNNLDKPFYNNGQIDLNAFKIYVDGNLVYQPCLKIPYTESKTGSKIVDEVYRDRVIDLYEQQGQAGYYTIDEKNRNFTLPMGEIYGMIGGKVDFLYLESKLSAKADSDILDTKADIDTPSIQAPYIKSTYINGTSGYIIWSDGYCEQWGRTAAATGGTITFGKTFADTNFNFVMFELNGNTGWSNTGYKITINSGSTVSWNRIDTCANMWKATGYLATGQY